jgi:two-component system cell cycle response regulator
MKTILIIDDSRLIREMLKDVLRPAGYRIIEAETGHEGIVTARGSRPDLIIVDIVMPEMDGIEACRVLNKMSETSGIPVIILTVRASTADIKAGLEAGAVDYITKPFNGDELLARVDSAVKIKEFKDQIESLKLRFKEITSTDDLTGLKNAAYFWDYLGREIKKSARKQVPLSLVIIDLDDFKTVNDSFGHIFGDEVLKEVAQTLKGALGKKRMIARYGGEEFVAVLSNTDEDRAFAVTERMRSTLAHREFSRGGKTFVISSSCGVATMTHHGGDLMEEPVSLFERADRALYEAKMSGKGMTVVARSGSGGSAR